MASEPLISVITPTWDRHDKLLTRCIPSVADQECNYAIEHIIVSDGPDPELERKMWTAPPHVSYHELPEHTPANGRWGTAARLFGIERARGEYIAYLDDDDKFRPYHLTGLADMLRTIDGPGFAYSVGLWMLPGAPDQLGCPFGSVPPIYGQIGTGTIMNNRAALEVATWRDDGQQATIDWDLVERWLISHVPFKFDPRHEAGTEFIPHPSEGFR